MRPFRHVEAAAVPLPLANVDTDQIVPARFLKRSRAEGYGEALFHDLRRGAGGELRSDLALNDDRFAGAQILVAGDNFGCGSSREGAVYALVDAGFRAVIAPGFGDIFRSNALKNGLLPVVLPKAVVTQIMDELARGPGSPLAIDLKEETVRLADGQVLRFPIDPFPKELLLTGRDELELTLGMAEAIGEFEDRHAAAWPWTRPSEELPA
ncbi:3-isopropylmalate dehydratase small subunit [Acuticoccus sp.]|uniref:3-isopropylmalate dehydratase small subunit n=1 Tax=Acuticoccus sp. TaxID=1904378 RepID=UPI003B52C417